MIPTTESFLTPDGKIKRSLKLNSHFEVHERHGQQSDVSDLPARPHKAVLNLGKHGVRGYAGPVGYFWVTSVPKAQHLGAFSFQVQIALWTLETGSVRVAENSTGVEGLPRKGTFG